MPFSYLRGFWRTKAHLHKPNSNKSVRVRWSNWRSKMQLDQSWGFQLVGRSSDGSLLTSIASRMVIVRSTHMPKGQVWVMFSRPRLIRTRPNFSVRSDHLPFLRNHACVASTFLFVCSWELVLSNIYTADTRFGLFVVFLPVATIGSIQGYQLS